MQIAKVSGTEVLEVNHYKKMFPNVSFPKGGPTDAWLSENSCVKVLAGKTFNADTQKLQNSDPYVEDSVVYLVEVVDLTEEELSAKRESELQKLSIKNRTQRDNALKETDWTQLPDSPLENVKVTEFATYRQALRDLTDHANWPELQEGDWPTTPVVSGE